MSTLLPYTYAHRLSLIELLRIVPTEKLCFMPFEILRRQKNFATITVRDSSATVVSSSSDIKQRSSSTECTDSHVSANDLQRLERTQTPFAFKRLDAHASWKPNANTGT